MEEYGCGDRFREATTGLSFSFCLFFAATRLGVSGMLLLDSNANADTMRIQCKYKTVVIVTFGDQERRCIFMVLGSFVGCRRSRLV